MGRYRVSVMVAMAIVVLGGCDDDNSPVDNPPPPPPPPPAAVSTNAVILEWNQLLTQNQGAGNLYSFRQYAISGCTRPTGPPWPAAQGRPRKRLPHKLRAM